jgi:hypothetical protein
MACDEAHIDARKYGDLITLLPYLLPSAGAYHARRTVIASNFMRDLASPP